MRILAYFGGRLLESRGTPSRARNLIEALGALADTDLAALSGDSAEDGKRGLAVEHISIPTLADRENSLHRAVSSFEPDVVYGHTHKAMRAMRRLSGKAATRVVDLHGHAAIEKLEAPGKSLRRRLTGFASAYLAEVRGLRAMDGLTACSTPLAARFRGTGKPTRVIWGGADLDLFRPLERPPKKGLRLAYAGNYRPYQGVDILLEACRRLLSEDEDFELSLVGDLDPFPHIKRQILQLGDRVKIHGQIEYQRMPRILSASNILVIPRPAHRTAEFGFPSKLAEYLAMERPTIATRVGDQARAISDMKNGLIVAPGSVDELHRAVLRLKDPELRSRLGRAGRRYAEEHLAWPALARRVELFLSEVHDARG